MAKKFQEQGGVATMDPSPLLRWLTSRLMTWMINPQRLAKKRRKIEKQRVAAGEAHVVEYFHQVEDGYSHLAAQVLKSLAQRYDIELRCHLVWGPQGNNSAEPELLLKLSRYDSGQVATEYGLDYPKDAGSPRADLVVLAESILAAQDTSGFIACAAEVGTALWAGNEPDLQALADKHGFASDDHTQSHIEACTARREKLRHYSGAMFYYGEEWYWGVDRLYHLEKRLAELGADREPERPMLVPRPAVEAGALKDQGQPHPGGFPLPAQSL